MAEDPFPFEVLEVLGEGAFGAVCVARLHADPLQRQVAIKVLKQEYAANPKVLHRTRDEARLLSRLHHPNIVAAEQLLDAGGRPILVMELVRGHDLKTLMRKTGGKVPAAVAMEAVRLACVALHVAYHESVSDDGEPMHVIHRDIKPSNMLLSVHGQLKVVDFGIATGRFSDRESHTESVVMGSRPYMAPERLDRGQDTPAVDVYSAGMSLYELLTGHVMPLSVNPTSHDRSMAGFLDALKVPGLGADGLADLRRLLHRTLAYDPSWRPAARDVAAELGRLLDGLDPAHRISLEAYARDVVEPLYAARERVPLQVAIGALQDRELLTSALPRAGNRKPLVSPELHKRPALFLGAVFGLVVGLGALAANKLAREQGPSGVVTVDAARVRFWFPSDATASVGARSLALPGHLDLPPGPTWLDVRFQDGRALACPFDARHGSAVRYVVDRGEGAVSIDDGPAEPCEDVSR